jgi:hypothetical protein
MPKLRAARPYMPAYGVPSDPEGMVPWSFAEERLTTSHDYWVATVLPDGRPPVMPVWGLWYDDRLWFSTDPTSRKGRNLAADPRCTVTTDNALEPVILDGVARLSTDTTRFMDEARSKYASEWVEDAYTFEFFDGRCYEVEPASVFALDAAAFSTSPTRFVFDTENHSH